VTEAVPDNPQGVTTKTIPGGRLAVLRHVGSHERLGESVYYLYSEWLPGSGAELRDFPVYFHYLTLVPGTPEHEHQTDVCLPIK
jgi:AraC family transcriptional regulator